MLNLPDPLKLAIAKVSDDLDADVLFYCGPLDEPYDDLLRRQICGRMRRTNAILFLSTYGGSADCAYRIARCIQRQYSEGKFIAFVDSMCKSAGTLLVIGADEVVMSESSELGPLDVQVSQPDEWVPASGLAPQQALDTLREGAFESFEDYFLAILDRSGLQITTRTAAEIATGMATGLFKPIYEQIDPMRLGEVHRALRVAMAYGNRLKTVNLKDGALDKLVTFYPSHGFVIDCKEARELFNNVREPTDEETEIADALRPVIEKMRVSRNAIATILSVEPDPEEEVEQDEPSNASEPQTNDGARRNEARDAPTGETPPLRDDSPADGTGLQLKPVAVGRGNN